MGHEGKRVKPEQGPGTFEWSGGRKVGTFWGKNEKALAVGLTVVGVVIFLLFVLFLFVIFPPTTSPPPEKETRETKNEESVPRFLHPSVPSLLFGKPERPAQRPLPSFRQKLEEKAIPIHWSGHHGHGGHHGHHGYHGHHYSPYYFPPAIIVRPWGYDPYYTPYGYGGCYGCGYGRGYEEEERRPYFELHRRPNGETQMRWGFQ